MPPFNPIKRRFLMEKQDTITTGLLLLVIAFIIVIIAAPTARHAIFPPPQIESCQHQPTEPCACVPCEDPPERRLLLQYGVDFTTSNVGTELILHLSKNLKEKDIIKINYSFQIPNNIFGQEINFYISATALVGNRTTGMGATTTLNMVGSCCFPIYIIEATQDTISIRVFSQVMGSFITINPENLEVMLL